MPALFSVRDIIEQSHFAAKCLFVFYALASASTSTLFWAQKGFQLRRAIKSGRLFILLLLSFAFELGNIELEIDMQKGKIKCNYFMAEKSNE